MLDGSIAGGAGNMLIYATSNRRHLLPEYFSENLETKHVGDEVHPGESVEEKISLSERFGLWISFYPFAQDDYLAAVDGWLAHFGVDAAADRARRARRARARRCSSRCSAARAAAASPGSSRESYAGAAGAAQAAAARERAALRRASPPPCIAARPTARCCSRSARRQGLRRLLGISRRQARARRDAARRARARAARGARHRRAPRRAVARAAIRLSARARRAALLPRVRVGRRAGRPRRAGVRVADAGRASTSRRCCPPTRACCARWAAAGLRHHACAATSARTAFLARAAARRSTRGLRLVQLREKDWPRRAPARVRATRCVALAQPHGAHGAAQRRRADARARWGCDGVHWTVGALARRDARGPTACSCAASCHTREEIARAGALGLDFAVLGPVRADADAPGRAAARLGRLCARDRGDARCRCSRWAGSRRPTSTPRSRTARTASRCARGGAGRER